jgi:DNA-binding MarR family transcriptional regulator
MGHDQRRPHPGDRRSVLVELSPQAAERTPAALAAFHARITQIAADVPEPHREAIARFLDEAAAAAADAAAGLRRPPPGR